MLSGIVSVSQSMKKTVSRRTKKMECAAKLIVKPSAAKKKMKAPPQMSSTIGYRMEIHAPQLLHFPRKNKYDSTGISSYHLRVLLQLGQNERGMITDILREMR